jgi:hypothetical protein
MARNRIGEQTSFNGTTYEIRDEILFQQPGHPTKEISIQKLHDLNSNDVEIRYGYYNDNHWIPSTLMSPVSDFQYFVQEAKNRGWITIQ